ncbi:RNA methyltransferase [Lentisphaera marina]|uniref:TrmH family RNA methyltransferase n=1 Tax=Lentisphaera marina TaxID=1111041 RepID=UPI0023661E8A|nr:RNA methyltransferase [Lentisphaera marina]MDD7984428.1 RNA methyltransferase [Lentisphaera marina]
MNSSLPRKIRQEFTKLKTRGGRRKSEYFLCEGKRCCEEALKYSPELIAYCVVDCESHLTDSIEHEYVLTSSELAELSLTENPQGILMLMKRPPKLESVDELKPFVLVLDGVAEPGNMGTILRTALAVGLKKVVLTAGTVDPYNAKAVRSGMGAQFRLQFIYINSLADLASDYPENNFWLTSPRAETSIYSKEFDLAESFLVFGEEGDGIQDFSVGDRVNIPMPGDTESLNVAQAATLFLFEGVRRNLV